MVEKCKKCEGDIALTKDALKCKECGGYFHPACANVSGESFKKSSTRNSWKCEYCVEDRSSTGSRASEPAQTVVLEAINAFRKENNERFDESNNKLNLLQTDLNTVVRDVGALKVQFEELKQSSDQTVSKVEELTARSNEQDRQIAVLQREVAELQQHTRKNNIIISGVPLTVRENLFVVLDSLARLLDVQFNRSDVSAAHRLPTPLGGEARPPSIVVCFVSRATKADWLAAKKQRRSLSARELHGTFPDHQIYINEHLTPQTRDLFNGARALVRAGKLASVWTNDGRVLAKKSPSANPFRIWDLRQLAGLGEQPAASDTIRPSP